MKTHPDALQYSALDVVKAALEQDGSVLEYASHEMKADLAVVMVAVAHIICKVCGIEGC